MKLMVGADQRLPVVETVLQWLQQQGHEPIWCGPQSGDTGVWSEIALNVANAVQQQQVDEGILLCWTGTGVSLAANKVSGIRAALCCDSETAKGARLWNNANILCLSMRTTTDALAQEILTMWFNTEYDYNQDTEIALAKFVKK